MDLLAAPLKCIIQVNPPCFSLFASCQCVTCARSDSMRSRATATHSDWIPFTMWPRKANRLQSALPVRLSTGLSSHSTGARRHYPGEIVRFYEISRYLFKIHFVIRALLESSKRSPVRFLACSSRSIDMNHQWSLIISCNQLSRNQVECGVQLIGLVINKKLPFGCFGCFFKRQMRLNVEDLKLLKTFESKAPNMSPQYEAHIWAYACNIRLRPKFA